MDYFDSTCGQTYHSFARDNDDSIQAYHGNGTLCEHSEFRFGQMLADELEHIIECPWCLSKPVNQDHIRQCSGYKSAPTREEIMDAYSHPSEQAKRDSLLRDIT